ncbi:MAG TPA: GGDEF domain-containing response regulator [Rickettsiales bacterium]|nr:GGDEF domain-containing response regulator [Rickettsiales bacterium]
MNLLLIDDAPTDALLVQKALNAISPDGYHIQYAANLREALQSLSENTFDIILLDLHLPDTIEFSGLSTIQNVAPSTPVIILTSLKDEDMAMRGVAGGAQDYLFKDNINGPGMKRAIQYAVQRKQLEGNLLTKANFDTLTGLANRSFFENRLNMALEKSKRHTVGIGVFFLDLDRFKQVNDTLGHAAGDALLKAVAERLKESVRPYDTAARFGGDEFAVLMEDIPTRQDCATVAQKIIHKITEPFSINNQDVEIGVSIGIAFYMSGENEGTTCELLMRQSDLAMYAAKKAAGNLFRFYNEIESAE